tara:strand:+ start:1559 stop:1855 length:297 start_codon:yes stop_codon:yes gene_type:complete
MFWNKPKVSSCTSCSEVKAYKDMDGSLHSNQKKCSIRNKFIKERRRRDLFIKDLELACPKLLESSRYYFEDHSIVELMLMRLGAKGLTLQIVKIKDVI